VIEMPRGKKKDASETLEQQIQSLQENIETYQRKIAVVSREVCNLGAPRE
jgi:hypothetical protein